MADVDEQMRWRVIDLYVVQRSRSKEELWKQVESALSNITANELLSALCVHADETAISLALRTAAIDAAKDAEKLRYEIFVHKH